MMFKKRGVHMKWGGGCIWFLSFHILRIILHILHKLCIGFLFTMHIMQIQHISFFVEEFKAFCVKQSKALLCKFCVQAFKTVLCEEVQDKTMLSINVLHFLYIAHIVHIVHILYILHIVHIIVMYWVVLHKLKMAMEIFFSGYGN